MQNARAIDDADLRALVAPGLPLPTPDPVAVLISYNRTFVETIINEPPGSLEFEALCDRNADLDTEILAMRAPTMRGLVARLEWLLETMQDQDVEFPVQIAEACLADARALSAN